MSRLDNEALIRIDLWVRRALRHCAATPCGRAAPFPGNYDGYSAKSRAITSRGDAIVAGRDKVLVVRAVEVTEK